VETISEASRGFIVAENRGACGYRWPGRTTGAPRCRVGVNSGTIRIRLQEAGRDRWPGRIVPGGVAELVDAADLKSAGSNTVPVRFRPSPPFRSIHVLGMRTGPALRTAASRNRSGTPAHKIGADRMQRATATTATRCFLPGPSSSWVPLRRAFVGGAGATVPPATDIIAHHSVTAGRMRHRASVAGNIASSGTRRRNPDSSAWSKRHHDQASARGRDAQTGTLQSSGRSCAYDAIQIPYNIDRAKELPGVQSRPAPGGRSSHRHPCEKDRSADAPQRREGLFRNKHVPAHGTRPNTLFKHGISVMLPETPLHAFANSCPDEPTSSSPIGVVRPNRAAPDASAGSCYTESVYHRYRRFCLIHC
jgi:hypothetical protein